ncbi:unnamed protein product [Lathyrus sativus]|nr:unnamed protein product [Lathyrus sativus]
MEDGITNSIWRNNDMDWSALNSSGRSGGIITMWNRSKISALSSFCGVGFLGIQFLWKNQNLVVVNVYAPRSSADIRNLWRDLAKIKSKISGAGWIVGGDFNEVKIVEERKGISANSIRDMKVFSEFIVELKLTDLPVFGNKFTWFNSNGKCRSRMDRFLVDGLAISMLSLINQLVGDRDVSDHRHVWLKSNFVNWGPVWLKSAVAGNMLSQFKIDGQPTVSILQFADDTLLIGDGSVSNVWEFKAILWAFELTSGLKTNYSKSCLYGIHVEHEFLWLLKTFSTVNRERCLLVSLVSL